MAERTRDGRKVFTKEECDEKRLVIRTGPCKQHWLATVPPEIQNILKRNKGKLKVCKTRAGKKCCIIHVRDREEGVLKANYCQKCGKQSTSQCCTATLPWCSYKGFPICEYCGKKLEAQDHCGQCGTTEVQVMNTIPARADRPRCVMTESYTPDTRRYDYQFESALVVENMAMVTPQYLQKTDIRLIQAAGWRCPACGRSTAGSCPVNNKEHDIPISNISTISSLERNQAIVKETGFDFSSTVRKTNNELKNSIIRVMSQEPDNRWSLMNITISSFETKQDIKRVIDEVAYVIEDDSGRTTYKLKPGIKPFKLG